jgi:hypothetical protein
MYLVALNLLVNNQLNSSLRQKLGTIDSSKDHKVSILVPNESWNKGGSISESYSLWLQSPHSNVPNHYPDPTKEKMLRIVLGTTNFLRLSHF